MSPALRGGNLSTTGQVPMHAHAPSAREAPCFSVSTRDPLCAVHWGPSALLGDFQASSYQQCQPKSLLQLLARSSLPGDHPAQDGKLDIRIRLPEK